MSPCPSQVRLQELLASELGPGDEASLEAHISQCPDCLQSLERLTATAPLPALASRKDEELAWMDTSLVSRLVPRLREAGLPGMAGTEVGGKQANGSAALPPLQVPGFEIYEELGHGGMGVVYRARQVALKRVVALKVLRGGLGEHLLRFRAEAEAIARLQHPNIVQIHDVNLQGATPFLALEYVNGGSLAQAIRRQPQPPQNAAELVERLARAVQVAHDQGVLHRDLKPANVLLTAGNADPASAGGPLQSAIPKITDFGLAKIVDSGERLTLSHEIMGTPQYMAPEQVQGLAPSPAVDVYALGVILYELLAGRTPFEAESSFEVLQLVINEEPLPLTQLQRKLPTELETICHKCLAKEPLQRYRSAAALADDLRRFLDGEPIRARPVSSWQRVVKWTKRRPMLASLLTTSAALTLVALVSLSVAVVQARRAEGLEADRRKLAEDSQGREVALRQQAERLSARALLDVAISQCEKGAIDHGLHTFVRVAELADSLQDGDLDYAARVNLSSWRLHYARPWAKLPHADWVWAVAFSPDGRWVATGSKDGTARVWDVATGLPATAPLVHAFPVWALAFSPDSGTLLTGCGDARGEACLWNAATGKRIGSPLAHDTGVKTVAFSSDGQTFLTVSPDQAQVWQTAERQRIGKPLRAREALTTAAFSPDGRSVLTASVDGTAELWRSATGDAIGTIFRHPGPVTAVAFSPNGQVVLSGCAFARRSADMKNESAVGEARLWDAASGKPLAAAMPHPGPVRSVAFGPEGRVVLTGGVAPGAAQTSKPGGAARLWRAAPDDPLVGQPLSPFLEHPEPVWSLTLSPSGKTILTGAQDGHARLWSAATGEVLATLPRCGPFTLRQVAFSPDGRTIATATAGHFAGQEALGQLFEAPPEQELMALRGTGNELWASDLSRDGRFALTGHRQGTVALWDVASGRLQGTLEHPRQLLAWALFSPDGQSILAATTDPNQLHFWERATGKRRRPPLPHESWIRRIAISPDGEKILTSTEQGKVRLWETTGGRLRYTLEHPLPRGLCFSPDGRTFVACFEDGTAQLRDTDTGRLLQTWTHPASCEGGNFSPDGTLYMTGCTDGAARLWVVATGKLLGGPRSHASSVTATCFHPDGRSSLTGTEGGLVQRWDIALGRPLGPPLRRSQPIRGLSAAPDDKVLIRGHMSPTALLYRTPAALTGELARVKLAVQVLTGLETDADGAILALSATEWKARRLELDRKGNPFAAPAPASRDTR